jgi:hypothetical protein
MAPTMFAGTIESPIATTEISETAEVFFS